MLTKQECEAIRERMTAPASTPAEAVAAVPDLVETVEELRECLRMARDEILFTDIIFTATQLRRIDKALE